MDIIWLHVAAPFFWSQIGYLARGKESFEVALLPAGVVYVLMVIALVVFVYPLANGNPWRAALLGGLMGLLLFGVFEGTNAAIIKDWPWRMILVDTAWGIFLCGTVAGFTTLILAQQK